MAEKQLKSIKFAGLGDTYVLPEIDDSLSTSGMAADAKATGDALAEKANYSDVNSALTAKADKSETFGNYYLSYNGGKLELEMTTVSGDTTHTFTLNIGKEMYPIGSIYLTLGEDSPAGLYGGAWELIKDRFLFGAGDMYSMGVTGGEATHTLTVEEMPSHKHEIRTTPLAVVDQAFTWGDENLRGAGSSMWSEAVGGSQPHNNMPPFLTVRIWKRVA